MFDGVLQWCGKNGQPVQCSSARARKPNSSVDQEGMVIERIRELRKQRGKVLSSLTAKRREIDSLLTDKNNLEMVKVKLIKNKKVKSVLWLKGLIKR